MTTAKERPIVSILSSPRSFKGASSISDYLKLGGFNVLLVREESKESKESRDIVRHATRKADIILCHNTLKIEKNLRERSILYALQRIHGILLRDRTQLESIQNQPFRRVLTNTKALAQMLGDVGISAQTVYRPNSSIKYDPAYVPLPREEVVLWYWKPDHPPMQPYLDGIRKAMAELSDVTIYTFPSEVPPIEAPHVRALGRIDLATCSLRVRGLVRVSDPLDLGRSTFDVIARGRFFLGLGMEEAFAEAAPDIDQLPGKLRGLLKYFDDAQGRALHDYARRFTLEGRSQAFSEIVREALGCAAAPIKQAAGPF